MKLEHVEFLDRLMKELDDLGIDLSGAIVDHIAYQANSAEDYNTLKPKFEKIGELIKEPLVGGRRVGVFKIFTPLKYKDQEIKAIELIEPVDGQVCRSALEHAEFLLPVTLEEFIEKYPNINLNKDAINRKEFPMLILRLSDNMQAKFPRYSILND